MATSCGFESHRPHQPSLAKRVTAAAPKPTGGGGLCVRELRLASHRPGGLRVAQPCETAWAKRVRRSLSASESEDGPGDNFAANPSFRNAPAGDAEQHHLRR